VFFYFKLSFFFTSKAKTKRTKKYAEVKRTISLKDTRMYVNIILKYSLKYFACYGEFLEQLFPARLICVYEIREVLYSFV